MSDGSKRSVVFNNALRSITFSGGNLNSYIRLGRQHSPSPGHILYSRSGAPRGDAYRNERCHLHCIRIADRNRVGVSALASSAAVGVTVVSSARRKRLRFAIKSNCSRVGGMAILFLTLHKIIQIQTHGVESREKQVILLAVSVGLKAHCQSASDRDPRSASKRDFFVLRFERLALAPSELVGVAETARARVVV